MKYLKYICFIGAIAQASCTKIIDISPVSNIDASKYYTNENELNVGLTGCYNGLQNALNTEWQLTELRSDNTKMGSPGSQSSVNRDLSDLDMFMPATTHQGNYTYWLASYNNIRNANIVLQKLGVTYDPTTGSNTFNDITIAISDQVRKQIASEALFIRAYHYFNLVRLYGGVFLVNSVIAPSEAKTINRATVADTYKFIIADLDTAINNLSALPYNQIAAANKGRINSWAAKALLAKVYLTLGKKTEAASLLQDVISNSGCALQSNYASVFSIQNEVNSEILFTVRYKSGNMGLGSSFGNDFAPTGSGNAVINGDGNWYNTPTVEIDGVLLASDKRRTVCLGKFITGTSSKVYVNKFLTPVITADDGESDWPIIRYADVLLLLAEANGFSPESIALINTIRARAGLANLPASVNSVAAFEKALANERRLEFAFENQRYFDLLRYNTTFTTITAEAILKAHFATEFKSHYSKYPAPTPTLVQLQANVTTDKLLLPIPQHEFDTNPALVGQQNSGY